MKFNMDSSLAYLVTKLSISSKNSLNKLIKPYGVSQEQLSVLFRVVENEGISQKELSDATYKDQGNLTRMIDKLVEKGYLVRDFDEKDRRSIKLFSTHSSKQLVQKTIPSYEALNKKILDGFSSDEEQQFVELLNKAYINLK